MTYTKITVSLTLDLGKNGANDIGFGVGMVYLNPKNDVALTDYVVLANPVGIPRLSAERRTPHDLSPSPAWRTHKIADNPEISLVRQPHFQYYFDLCSRFDIDSRAHYSTWDDALTDTFIHCTPTPHYFQITRSRSGAKWSGLWLLSSWAPIGIEHRLSEELRSTLQHILVWE